MEVDLFSIEQFYVYLIILARMAAVVAALPVFTASEASMRMRVGLAAAVSLLLFPVLDISVDPASLTPAILGLIVLREALLGLLLGFTIQLIFFAVQFGGTVVGYQMGFAAANILDPQNQEQMPLVAQFQNVFAILVFLVLNAHHAVIRVMIRSYEILPPGNLDFSGRAVPFLMELTGQMFVLGIQLVAPVIAALIVSQFILGIMSRVFSQLQVFLLSFPINISLALIIIGLSAEMIMLLLEYEFFELQERLLRLLRML